ncbi:4'-phosphopantetheinyl transferase superfamily protein [Aquimarina sp. ERC-38]|uniref:4'-phosphopantetheinyl transferase family protein n=1 Tax=Aquimarina sp. ERC-38 TaxID=2949996 RepID=UPI0022458985|nr:4'-phosphopantetheinyl transferase superfamily protein [Aquimarina sp. ERC-38]UZO81604.1 4'-phosphopantetheinyl transferase superfamily protein [Aquimarina sp. ERC-38]
MPLYKTITVDAGTTIWIWKIIETTDQLLKNIELTPYSTERLSNMSSVLHQRGFASVRQLLKVAGYKDKDLYYNDLGKPFLQDSKSISITHSYHFSAIIVSDSPTGIDIEKQRKKIGVIKDKFIGNDCIAFTSNQEENIRLLTIAWGAKESIYKMKATPGVSLKNHIEITSILKNKQRVQATFKDKKSTSKHQLAYLEFEGFTCVYLKPPVEII